MSDQQRPVLGGRYELYRRIARGGMAEVFLARDQLLDRPVAVKVLFPEFATDPAFVERFRREAQAAANLTHANIVGVYDWGAERGTYYIVMEYVEGKNLAEIVRTDGPIDPERAADIASEVAAALSMAHAGGVVHRDVKPGNVLITSAGLVKVADFGIARALSGPASDGLTQTGSVMGTATYLSPEQAQGQPADPRSDVYALAVVLYEMLTGRPPFTGDTPVAIAFEHVREEPVAPRKRNSAVPEALQSICLHGLAKEPAQRYASADEMRGDLKRFLGGSEPLVSATARGGAAGAAATSGPGSGESPPASRPRAAAPVPESHDPGYAPTTAMPTGAAPPPAPGYGPEAYAPQYDDYPSRQTGLYVVAVVALIAVLAVLAFLFVRALGGEDGPSSTTVAVVPVTVADVVGLDVAEAVRILEEQGLVVDIEEVEDDVAEPGEVTAQFPRGDQEAVEGDTVRLTVSKGQGLALVPDLVGKSEEQARALLKDVGFVPEIIREQNDEVDEGTVLAQDPAAEVELTRGESVRVTVSTGAELVELPDVTGMTEREAYAALSSIGVVVTFDEEPSSTVEKGRIIRTTPAPKTQVQRGDSVTLVSSSGPAAVVLASYEGADPVLARNELERLGLVVKRGEVVVPFGSDLAGKVVATNPPAGISVFPGDTVTLSVGVPSQPPSSSTTTSTTSTTTTTTTAPPSSTTTTTTTTTG